MSYMWLVSVADEPADSALKLTMRFVESVVDAKLPDFGELAFDAIEPRRIGRRPNQATLFSRAQRRISGRLCGEKLSRMR